MVLDWSRNGPGLVLWCGDPDIWSSVYCSVLLSSCSMLECWPQLLLNNWRVFSEWGWGGWGCCCWWKFKDAVFQHFGIFANSGEKLCSCEFSELNFCSITTISSSTVWMCSSLLRYNLDHKLLTSWRWAYSRWMTFSGQWNYQAGHVIRLGSRSVFNGFYKQNVLKLQSAD